MFHAHARTIMPHSTHSVLLDAILYSLVTLLLFFLSFPAFLVFSKSAWSIDKEWGEKRKKKFRLVFGVAKISAPALPQENR